MGTIEAAATTPASPAGGWALLADASKWSQWGAWSKVEIEGGGDQGPGAVRVHQGPGAVRVQQAGPFAALVLRLAVRDACKRVAKAAAAAS